MAKRFTDTAKWLNPWYRKLPSAFRELWNYILDTCDNAGIWRVDLDMGQAMFHHPFTEADCFLHYQNRIVSIDHDKWFIPSFIEFQYGKLKPECKPHLSAIKCLEKHGIDPLNLTLSKQYPNSIHTNKEKDKDKDKEKDKDQEKEKSANFEIQKPLIPLKAHMAEVQELIAEWGVTLKHFKITKDPQLDEVSIAAMFARHGFEKTRLALIGQRFEEGTKTYSPSKHLSILRVARPDHFEKCVNLGAQDQSTSGTGFADLDALVLED